MKSVFSRAMGGSAQLAGHEIVHRRQGVIQLQKLRTAAPVVAKSALLASA